MLMILFSRHLYPICIMPASKTYFEEVGMTAVLEQEADDGDGGEGEVRTFDFMCLRYVWRPELQRFDLWNMPTPSPQDILKRVASGGLSDEHVLAARQLAGPNRILVPKTTFIWDLLMEVGRPLYLVNILGLVYLQRLEHGCSLVCQHHVQRYLKSDFDPTKPKESAVHCQDGGRHPNLQGRSLGYVLDIGCCAWRRHYVGRSRKSCM